MPWGRVIPSLCVKEHGEQEFDPAWQAFQHYGVNDMRLNFVEVYPSDCGIHDGDRSWLKRDRDGGGGVVGRKK